MSTDAGLYVYLEDFRAADILDCYEKSGLSLYDARGMAYIISSEDDSFEWEYIFASREKLDEIILHRQKCGFPVGISLYENGECITDLLITSDEFIILSCDINRKEVILSDDSSFTDVNYYIGKLILPLLKQNFKVVCYKYIEA
ncbi:MAG: hypothetical protein ACI4RH_03835 [Huintestinicola sp.]